MDNYYFSPTKSNSASYFHDSNKDSSDSSISGIYPQDSPSNNPRNFCMINASSDDTNTFYSNGTCVTSTPVGRCGAIQQRKSSLFRPKRYSLKAEHDKRVDISDHVKVFESNRNNIEESSNYIHMTHLKFKYSRLNPIYRDFAANAAYIYLYPRLFNSDIMKSKFVSQTPLSNVFLVDHRFDGDRYVLKMGEISKNNFLSPTNRKIIHEIRILKLLGDHPNIVEYCDSWLEEDRIHLQLRHASGGSLQDFLALRRSSLASDNNIFLSKTAAIVLLAQMGSVLAYLHDILEISHGAITTEHILVDHMCYFDETSESDNEQFRCYKALASDEMNFDLRFKLCDFIARETAESIETKTYDEDLRDMDILSLGITIFNCFCGIDQRSVYNPQDVNQLDLLGKISDEWDIIIMNMCHKDPRHRWTARNIISLDGIDKYILPEARCFLLDYTNSTNQSRHFVKEPTIDFVKPFDNNPDVLLFSHDNYWIKSDYSNEMVDITREMNSIAMSRRRKEESLDEIHQKYLKFKNFKLSKVINGTNPQEKCIFDYPVLFNSEVTSSKFSLQTLISETKLSMIYIAYHRFDGDSYILKVGLQSATFVISDSSREIINEMGILKLIKKHPNVVGYCDCWIEQEKFHLQLKFVPGGSLYDFTQGHFDKFYVLSDTMKRSQKFFISSQSAYVLLAHMISVLVYLHDELRIFHGDIKPSNILVELVGRNLDPDYFDNAKLYCHEILVSEEINMSLRFKLCDFGRSGPTANISSMEEGDGRYLPNLSERFDDSDYHIRATSRDIFSLGLSIYDCFGGVIDQDSARDIRIGSWREWPERVTDDWRQIIMNLSHLDPTKRWTANQVIMLDGIQTFILPEAKYHLSGSDRYIRSRNYDTSLPDIIPERCEVERALSPVNVSSFISDDMEVSF